MKIAPPVASRPAAPTPPTAAEKKAHDLDKASHEFEAIFVRSVLKNSGVGSTGSSSGAGAYGDLAVNAVADAVTAGKGLGLGEMIKRAVEKAHEGLKKQE